VARPAPGASGPRSVLAPSGLPPGRRCEEADAKAGHQPRPARAVRPDAGTRAAARAASSSAWSIPRTRPPRGPGCAGMAGRAEATFRLGHADGSWRSLGTLAAPLAEADEGATSLRGCAPCGASTDRVFHFAPPLAPPDA